MLKKHYLSLRALLNCKALGYQVLILNTVKLKKENMKSIKELNEEMLSELLNDFTLQKLSKTEVIYLIDLLYTD